MFHYWGQREKVLHDPKCAPLGSVLQPSWGLSQELRIQDRSSHQMTMRSEQQSERLTVLMIKQRSEN